MMDTKNNNDVDAEIQAVVSNGSCNVVMKGAPDDLFSCMCSIICALSRQIMNEDEMKTLQSDMGLSDEMLEAYLTTMIINEILESMDNVEHIFSKFSSLDDEDWNKDMETLKEKFSSTENSSHTTEIDLDFDAITNKNSEDNNE